jgi:hypothetical protein
VEERLLHLFGTVLHAEQKITELQAMVIYDDVSFTAAHRRFRFLRQKGMITLVFDEVDTRIKYVMQTPVFSRYFAQLGQCLNEAQVD